MTKKIFILAIASIMFISFGLVLDAAPQRHKMMNHAKFGIHMAERNLFPAHMLLRHKSEIGLTADQVAKIEKMSESFREMQIRKQADIKVLELKFQSFMKKDKLDRNKMEKQIRDIAKLKTDMQIKRYNHLLDMKNLLTPEQMTKVDELKKKRRKEMFKKRMRRPRRDMRRQDMGKMGRAQ